MARGSLRDVDVAEARGEVLREVLACGWLSREFISKQQQQQQQHHQQPQQRQQQPYVDDTGGGDNNTAETAVCAAETSRWLFEVATDPASTREVALGARDALFAAAGYEPSGR